MKIKLILEIPDEAMCYDPRDAKTICNFAEAFYCNLFRERLTDARVINMESKRELKSMQVLPCKKCLEKRKEFNGESTEEITE